MNESDLWKKLKEAWKKTYPKGYITKISQRFASGFPDCIAIAGGRVNFIELKVKPNKPTKLQLHVLEEIRQAGGNAFVLTYDNKRQVYKLYDREEEPNYNFEVAKIHDLVLMIDDRKEIEDAILRANYRWWKSHCSNRDAFDAKVFDMFAACNPEGK